MIIDIHAHFTAPPELFAYKSNLLAGRGASVNKLKLSDEKIVAALILRRRWSLAFQQPGERRRVVLRNRSGQRRRGLVREVTHVRLGEIGRASCRERV